MRPDIEKAVELLQSKNPDALEQALALLQNSVFSFSMKVCGHREDAEDTMQDVLMKSVRYLPQFNNSKALVVWLYKVAKNRCLMSRRKSKFAPNEHLSLEELMPNPSELEALSAKAHLGQRATPETSLLREEDAERLHRAVLKLSPQYRLILVLHDMEELSTSEISQITKLTEGNVRVRLHRARLFIRKELAEETSGKNMRPLRAHTRAHQPGHDGSSKNSPAVAAGMRRPANCKQMFAALSNYLDGTLDDSMCEELEKHLSGCQPCEAFLNSLQQTVEQVRNYHPERPDPRAALAIRQKLLSELKQLTANGR